MVVTSYNLLSNKKKSYPLKQELQVQKQLVMFVSHQDSQAKYYPGHACVLEKNLEKRK